MKILLGELKGLINEALVNENVSSWVSEKVVLTPVIARAMSAMTGTSDAWHSFRVENRRHGVTISTYIEGYAKKKVYGQVSTYQSVGGDYNIPFNVSPDREVEERVTVFLMIVFGVDGRTTIELSDVDIRTFESSGKVIYSGRGFGKGALQALDKAAQTFRYWAKRFDE